MNFVHTDRQVARRLLDGDEAAFSAVFDDYFPRLYRYVLPRVGRDGDEARDIVQQTFCKAFERLDSYRGEASLYGWMYQICRNTLIDRARRRRHESTIVAAGDDDSGIATLVDHVRSPAIDEPEQDLARLDLLQLIQATLDYLPSHYGDVLELKYVDELPVKEIAVRLRIAPKAAESLLTRARQAFREAIMTIGGAADVLPRDLLPTATR